MDQIAPPANASEVEEQDRHAQWIHCPCCEAPCSNRVLLEDTELRCGRCGVRVKVQRRSYSLQPPIAFSTAGLLAAILANADPILTFQVVGDGQSGWIITGVEELYKQGYWPIAALVLFSSILAPILYLAAIWYVSAACFVGLRLPFVRTALRSIMMLEPWNLVPVYAIATVVAVVKLRMLGTVEWEVGARWVLGMALCSLFASHFFDHHLVEEKLESLGKR